MISFHASEPQPPQNQLLKPGDYSFKVLNAEEKTSQNGNEMIELKLDVYNGKDQSTVYDHLVVNEKSAWKIDHFLKSCGRHPGETDVTLVAEEMTGWEGKCKIINARDQNENPKNKVGGYLWENEIPF